MEHIQGGVQKVSEHSVNIATDTTNDIKEFNFYKYPVFIVFFLYTLFIVTSYLNMSNSTKNKYVFSDKFRDSTNTIHWLNIISYPYDFSKSTLNKIKIITTHPLTLYLLIILPIILNVIDPTHKSYKVYFYTVMFSYLSLMILFTIHVIIFKFIIPPETVKIELHIVPKDKVKRTYEAFYRTQWVLLFFLSPIIVTICIYISRKLNKSKLTN